MEEKHSAGLKQFLLVLLWAFLFYMLGEYISFMIPVYPIIGDIVAIALYCILAFFVLTRYSAVYTYSVKRGRIRITRTIGKRTKEIELSKKNITAIYSDKKGLHAPNTLPKPVINMRKSIFGNKNLCKIVFNKSGSQGTVIFEPSDKMLDEIISIKNSKEVRE